MSGIRLRNQAPGGGGESTFLVAPLTRISTFCSDTANQHTLVHIPIIRRDFSFLLPDVPFLPSPIMPSLPSLTSSENPSNSDTTLDKESVTNNVSSAMDDANEKSGSSAAAETKAGVAQSASEVEKAANKLYEENIEDEYAKREGGA